MLKIHIIVAVVCVLVTVGCDSYGISHAENKLFPYEIGDTIILESSNSDCLEYLWIFRKDSFFSPVDPLSLNQAET